MSKIFVSYSREAKAAAEALVADLENLGHDVWFDQDLSGGQAWWDQILATIRDYHVLVFVLEPNALNSTACRRELSYAAELGKPVLPVLVADGLSTNLLPPELSIIHWVNYTQRDGNSIIGLVKALNNIPPTKPLPDPLPVPPEVPVSYLGSISRKIDSATTLSYEEQSMLVIDLKAGLNDPATRDDARVLLEKMKNRHDLLAKIDREIENLLATKIVLSFDSKAEKASGDPKEIAQASSPAQLATPTPVNTSIGIQGWQVGVGIGLLFSLFIFNKSFGDFLIGGILSVPAFAYAGYGVGEIIKKIR